MRRGGWALKDKDVQMQEFSAVFVWTFLSDWKAWGEGKTLKRLETKGEVETVIPEQHPKR